jgi:hypothetical protein
MEAARNAGSLATTNPAIELIISILVLLGCGLLFLDIHLQHRKNSTVWTRSEVVKLVGMAIIGVGFLVLHFAH